MATRASGDGDQIWSDRRTARWLAGFMILGLVLRLVRFGLNHPLWRDEAFLVANVIDRDFLGLLLPLDFGQVCPIGFLWLEKGISLLLGCGERSLRLLPTVASVASLVLFRHLAGRLLRGRALMLAVAILAVGFTPIRYGGEVKPYETDFLLATALIALAVEWLRTPARVGSLWALAAFGPVAVTLSNPAVFLVASVGLVLAVPAARIRSARILVPLGVFGVGSGLTFLVLLRFINQPQGDHVRDWMSLYWANAFPPRSVIPLLGWLVRVHTSQMFAYPFGGDKGASTLTTILVGVAVVVFWRRGSRLTLALLLGPFALGLIAACLGRYPYGGSARTMQYVAPSIILLAGLGAASLIDRLARPVARQRLGRLVLLGLGVVGVGMLGWDLAYPYRALEDQTTRDFARRFWAEASRGAEVVCARTDLRLPLNPHVWRNNRAPLYLIHQAIYSDRHHAGTPPRLDRVSATHPLRVVLFNGDRADRALMERWVHEHGDRYRLQTRRERVLNPGLFRGKAPMEDRYLVYELAPVVTVIADHP